MKYINDISAALARNLIHYRTVHKLTQETLADKAKIAALTIWKIENCEEWPSPDTLIKITTVLEIEPTHLFIDTVKDSLVASEDIAERDQKLLSFLQNELTKFQHIQPQQAEDSPCDENAQYSISHSEKNNF